MIRRRLDAATIREILGTAAVPVRSRKRDFFTASHARCSRTGACVYQLAADLHTDRDKAEVASAGTAGEGVTFLGWRVFPDRSRLVRGNVVRFRRRMRDMRRSFKGGQMEWLEISHRIQSWIGHARQGDTAYLRERLLSQFAFEWSAAGR